MTLLMLAAAFGRERGLDIDEGADARDVLQKVHASCMPDDKEERFQYRYGEGTPEVRIHPGSHETSIWSRDVMCDWLWVGWCRR